MTAVEWRRVEQNEAEWSRVEQSGVEWGGVDWIRVKFYIRGSGGE